MRQAVRIVIAVACLAVATLAYVRFVPQSEQLWTSIHHDRNAHYVTILRLAADLRGGDLFHFVKYVVELAVWPPGSYLPPALFLSLTGADLRLAVIPNTLAWALSAFLAFLIARRCLFSGGDLAGIVAATLVLASPMHHGFAVDLMIESSGTLLTLVCLYTYLLAVQNDQPQAYDRLGLALTALIVTKYNYWLLVVLSLVLVQAPSLWHGTNFAHAVDTKQWRRKFIEFACHPLSVAIILLAVGAGVIAWLKPAPIAGVRLSPPTNAFQLLYILIIIRLALAFRPWNATLAAIDPRAAALIRWHLVPAALFMALPRHATTFVWYVSPFNGPENNRSLWEGVCFYAQALSSEYHASPTRCLAALALFLFGLIFCRRMRPGSVAIFVLALVSAFLTVKHPNHQERYAASWMPVVWIGTGLGLIGWLTFVAEAWRRTALALASLLVVGVLASLLPDIIAGKRSPLAGPNTGAASHIGLAQAIVKESRDRPRVVVLGSTPIRFLAEWAILEADGSLKRLEPHWFGFNANGQDNGRSFRRWLDSPTSDVILFAEVPGQTTDPECEMLVAVHRELLPILDSASNFTLKRTHDAGGLRLRVYERERSASAPR